MSLIDYTLADQLHITAFDLQERKEAFQLGEEDFRVLASFQSVVASELDRLVESLCVHITDSSEVDLAIGDKGSLIRVKQALEEYILQMFGGYCDLVSLDAHLRIGLVHRRVGVGPKLFLAAASQLSESLDSLCESRGPRLLGPEKTAHLRRAVQKMVRFNTHLILEGYISALESQVANASAKMLVYTKHLEDEVGLRTRELERRVQHDSLTGLLNREAFYERLRHELAAAKGNHRSICLGSIDLNGFKEINDVRGHLAGDEILAYVGRTLAASVRETDIVARQGGDEFAVIFPDTEIHLAREVCDRLCKVFASAIGYPITFSMGVVQSGPESFPSAQELAACADALMYKAKEIARQNHEIQVEYETVSRRAV